MRGDHAPLDGPAPSPLGAARLTVPVDAPAGLLNRVTLGLFNEAYYRAPARPRRRRSVVPYAPFFFPLDGVGDWTRLYGPRGFVQYQCVVPEAPRPRADPDDLRAHRRSGEPASLARAQAIRRGAARPACSRSRGRGSRWPWTSPSAGPRTFALLDDLDAVVREAGGAVYPAKDARMSPESFRAFFPRLERFAAHRDPKFSSSFWRRVHAS